MYFNDDDEMVEKIGNWEEKNLRSEEGSNPSEGVVLPIRGGGFEKGYRHNLCILCVVLAITVLRPTKICDLLDAPIICLLRIG